ncbi:hypothetical protein MASR1M65_15280 [Saprospiraceae bacterium]
MINILKSYKFTITENTPIEEDVALDPELLGKVFENLLASYNPETKTTARKQTGSFYTPREIVNYMVDESLIAYLKNNVPGASSFGTSQNNPKVSGASSFEISQSKDALDTLLHQLVSFDNINPFKDDEETTRAIITALSSCTILGPACGSGAFPMGVLQKMVHILQKLDPENKIWKEVQRAKAEEQTLEAFDTLEDKHAREQRLLEINDAFDQNINDPDYARKLFLIENCIYGVDIQPIATQISKLRFFISLVTEQKVNPEKDNFGIRPLPNLETKFVAANTLIGIEKENNLFSTDEIKALEKQLKKVRSKLFSARTKETKLKYREQDKELRYQIADALKSQGLPLESAEKLAVWDPYNQNTSSPFFDPEWMFDIKDGFDVVIGNPPYLSVEKIDKVIKDSIKLFRTAYQKYDLYVLFYEKGISFLKTNGFLSYITSNKFLSQGYGLLLRKFFLLSKIFEIVNFNYDIFENATVRTCILNLQKTKPTNNHKIKIIDVNTIKDIEKFTYRRYEILNQNVFNETEENNFRINLTQEKISLLKNIEKDCIKVEEICSVNYGLRPSSEKLNLKKEAFIYNENPNNKYKPYFEGKDMGYWKIANSSYLDYQPNVMYNGMFKELFEYEKLVGLRTLSDINKLRFIYDNNGFYCNDAVVILTLWYLFENVNYQTVKRLINQSKINYSKQFSYKYLQAILNSKLIKFYVNELFYDGTHFYPNHMKALPIKPTISLIQMKFDVIVEFLHFLQSQKINQIIPTITNKDLAKYIENVLNLMVCELYFPDHMKERGIDVLEFVERDITEVMQGREFEKLTDSQKEQVIEQLHHKWTDPQNEVVKRMAQFKEKSPEILKPILES